MSKTFVRSTLLAIGLLLFVVGYARGQGMGGGIFGPTRYVSVLGTDPATCGTGRVWVNSTTHLFKVCTDVNTISSFVGSAGGTFTGPVLIADGTAAAPSLAFASDADGTGTGIYRSAANTLAISTNGVQQYVVDASSNHTFTGNVGIGSAPSGADLIVSKDVAGGFVTIQVKNVSATGRARFIASAGDGTTSSGLMYFMSQSLSTAGYTWIFGQNDTTGRALIRNVLTSVNAIAIDPTTSVVTTTNGLVTPSITLTGNQLTAGTMTLVQECTLPSCTTCRDWTNSMVAALPGTAGDIAFGTLPAKTILKNAYVIITGAAAGPATVTVAVGRTGASYIDYIVASDAKAAANTVYGDVSGERGTNLTGYDLPSYTGTTLINAHFISSGANLSTVTGSTGRVCVTTEKLP